jgi:hypothetical protein
MRTNLMEPFCCLSAHYRQPLLPGFNRGFVNPVKLEEFAVFLTDFLFHMTIPKISSEAKGSMAVLGEGGRFTRCGDEESQEAYPKFETYVYQSSVIFPGPPLLLVA